MKINTPGCGHGNFVASDGSRFWEYSSKADLSILRQAVSILEHSVKGMKQCNACFKKLPGGRSFDDILADNSVWINYEPRTIGWYGATDKVGGKEVTVSKDAFSKGRWWVAGTLVHELAHVNGADATTSAADTTLLSCGLKVAYEGAIGKREAGTRWPVA